MGGWELASPTNTPQPLRDLLLPPAAALWPAGSHGRRAAVLAVTLAPDLALQLPCQEVRVGAGRGLPLLLWSLWALSFAQL